MYLWQYRIYRDGDKSIGIRLHAVIVAIINHHVSNSFA